MTRRNIYFVDPEGERLGASFWMDGRELRVEYASQMLRRRLEGEGITARGAQVIFPASGQAFYDALPIAFARSSREFVRDE